MARVPVLTLVLALLVLGAWFTVGPRNPVLPWVVGIGAFGVLGMVGHLPRTLAPRCVRVPGPRTISLAGALGIPALLRLLESVGWNRRLGRGRHTVHGRAGLREVRDQARRSLTSHWCGAVFHVLVAALLALVGAWLNAAVLLVLGVLLHGVPVLAQRYLLARIARIPRMSRRPLS